MNKKIVFIALMFLLPIAFYAQSVQLKAEKELQKLDAIVDLSEDQQAQILPILVKYHKSISKVRKGNTRYIKKMKKEGMDNKSAMVASKDNFNKTRKDYKKRKMEAIRSILTEDQINLYKNNRKK